MSVYTSHVCIVCAAPIEHPGGQAKAENWVNHVLTHPPEDVAQVLFETFEDALAAGARVDVVLDAADDALNHGDDTDLRALLAAREVKKGDRR